VAPYSSEYNTYRQRVGRQAHETNDTELEIEYEKILNRVKKTRESVIRMQDRHFTASVDEISGTVEEASPGGITLKEFPGRVFQFSSVSTSAADMSARILGEQNDMARCLHPAGHKTLRARASDRSPVHDSALSQLWLIDPVQGGDVEWCLHLARHQTPRARAWRNKNLKITAETSTADRGCPATGKERFAEPDEEEKKIVAPPEGLPNGGDGKVWEPFWEPQAFQLGQKSV
jgi:hypothetical protein